MHDNIKYDEKVIQQLKDINKTIQDIIKAMKGQQ